MTPKEQVEGLLGELLSFGRKMLVEYGEFHPFGAYLSPSGNMVNMGVKMEGGGGVERMELLHSALKGESDSAVAFGVASNVWLPQGNDAGLDAIKVFLEHRDGYCSDVFCPYDLSRNDPLIVSEMFAQRGEPVFFDHSSR